MKHDRTHYALLAAMWVTVVAAAVVLWRMAAEQPQAMPLEEFQRTVRKVKSDALEARALSLQLAANNLTRNFAEQQHRKIGDDLGDLRKALDKPPPRGRDAEATAAKAAVDRLDTLLKSVPAAMADPGALRRIAEQEAAVARALPGTPP